MEDRKIVPNTIFTISIKCLSDFSTFTYVYWTGST